MSYSKFGDKLSRICLNQMFKMSLSTICMIKNNCQSLRVLELHVDSICPGWYHFSILSSLLWCYYPGLLPLDQAIEQSQNGHLKHLVSLKLGGEVSGRIDLKYAWNFLIFIVSGTLLKFILTGCSLLKMLCFTPTSYEGGGINDEFIGKMFSEHPCKHLEVFCFERSFLSEQTFFWCFCVL